ncbi:MAG TPA: MFS transporter [Chromobacteriaceae bacterium]|nr:MFS transporter [Chromobacteriaceae bacterium]
MPFALFYFSYFAFQGVFNPFWGLYLQSLSFTPWQISVLVALSTLARIVAPGFWGWLADRQQRRRPIVIATSLAAAAIFALVGQLHSFAGVFVTLALALFFWAASLPLVEASTAWLTRAQPGRYSRVRVWGSIGFVVAATLGGYALEWLSLACLPWLALGGLMVVALVAFKLPEVACLSAADEAASIWLTLRQPKVLALFGCCFLMAFAHGPYYTFYSIGLKDAGYGKSLIGLLWSCGVVSEILIFLAMPRIMGKLSLERLMQLSLLAAVLRFGLIAGWVGIPLVAFGAQTLHALTFALHHAASIGLIHRLFAPQHHGRAQGLYIIASFGLGGSGGGLLAGLLWPQGGVCATFALSALVALLGVLVSLKWLSPSRESH